MKKKSKKPLMFIAILLFFILIVFIAGLKFSFQQTQTVYLPEVTSIECRPAYSKWEYDMSNAPWKDDWHTQYFFPAKELNAKSFKVSYYLGCNQLGNTELAIYNYVNGEYKEYDFPLITSCKEWHEIIDLKGRSHPGDLNGGGSLKVKARKSFMFMPQQLEPGEVKLRFEFNRYDLVYHDFRHGKIVTKNTCDLRRAGEGSVETRGDFFEDEFNQARAEGKIKDGYYLDYGQTLNYISGFSPSQNNLAAVDWDGDGQLDRYIVRVGYYFPIKKGLSGRLYADTRQEMYDPKIICMPGPYCKDGKEIIQEEECRPCNVFTGNIIGYAPKNDREVCKWRCVNGCLEPYDCKEIPKCGPNEILDINYNCVKLHAGEISDVCPKGYKLVGWEGDKPICQPELPIPWWLIAIIVVLFLALLLKRRSSSPQPIIISRR